MNRKEIRTRMEEVMGEAVTGDPATKQAKELTYLTAETLMEVINTLDRMDRSSKKMDGSNKELTRSNIELTKSNLSLAQRNLWLQVFIAGISVIALLVALFFKR